MHVLPNFVLGLFLSVAGIDNLVLASNEPTFYVVSPSSGSEKFYSKISRLGVRDEESRTREDILCAEILNSSFFTTDQSVEIVDPSDLRAYARFHPEMKDWFMFTRPYQMVNVSVAQNQTRREAVFPCLAKFKATNEIKMYLISHEYDFNSWLKREQSKCARVSGRFVFEYESTEKNLAQLVAVVEEPACRLDYVSKDVHHFDNLKADLDAISNGGRSICEFSTGRKVRICSVGLSAKEYRSVVTFLPFESSVEPECEFRELVFEHAYKRSWRYNTPTPFEFYEWVIGCKTELVAEPGNFTTYYVSLGYKPHQFLIYHPNKRNSAVSVLKHHFYSPLGVDNIEMSERV